MINVYKAATSSGLICVGYFTVFLFVSLNYLHFVGVVFHVTKYIVMESLRCVHVSGPKAVYFTQVLN